MRIILWCPMLCVLLLFQCNRPGGEIASEDLFSAYPIQDLSTEVPALHQDSVVPIVLENSSIRVVFDKNCGRLVSLVNKQTGWQIQRRAELSRSFRLAIPLPGRRDHCIYGEKQPNCSIEVLNHNKIALKWDKLESDCGMDLDISFTGFVELTEQGLQFTAEIDNRSPHTVEAVYWPYLGDLGIPDTQKNLGFDGEPLFPFFKNQRGYYGVDYPIQIHSTLNYLFGLLGNGLEGMYVCFMDTTDEYLLNFTFELKPGFAYAESMDYGTVPESDSISGHPVRIEYSCVHLPYIKPNESTVLHPVLFQPYLGGWQAGADYYKDWRNSWCTTLDLPDWAQNVHSWQHIHINSSEDYPRSTYKDLLSYAKECALHGVKAIQLTGWTIGGQDRGNFSHDTNPVLGNREDLKQAIAACEKLGVHVILFGNFSWADESQPWFSKELVRYAIKDSYGNYLDHWGYQYQTATQLADLNTRRLVSMCPLSSKWRKIAFHEFDKLVELGASGMLNNECQNHGEAAYCFDPKHGHRVPSNVYMGDRLLESGFRSITKDKVPAFLLAGQALRDLQFRNYHLSYTRIEDDHVPLQRYIAPYASIMIAVTGYNDRHRINQALLYRYIISYEPRHFKGHLTEFPLTLTYGKQIDSLRQMFSDFLWDGEYIGSKGAIVKVNGNAPVNYSVFLDHKSGNRALVVANPSYDRPAGVEMELEKSSGRYFVSRPEASEAIPFDGKIEIPPLSAVVLMERN